MEFAVNAHGGHGAVFLAVTTAGVGEALGVVLGGDDEGLHLGKSFSDWLR